MKTLDKAEYEEFFELIMTNCLKSLFDAKRNGDTLLPTNVKLVMDEISRKNEQYHTIRNMHAI